MASLTTIPIPPGRENDPTIMRTLAGALGFDGNRIQRVGDRLYFLEPSGIVRAAFMLDSPDVMLYDWQGEVPQIEW